MHPLARLWGAESSRQTVYSGEAQPEYNEATCLSNTLVLPDTRVVTLEVRGAARGEAAAAGGADCSAAAGAQVELSREVVPLRSAYTAVGRLAKLKVRHRRLALAEPILLLARRLIGYRNLPQVGVAEERVLTICSAPFPNGARSSDSRDVELDESIKNVLVRARVLCTSGPYVQRPLAAHWRASLTR